MLNRTFWSKVGVKLNIKIKKRRKLEKNFDLRNQRNHVWAKNADKSNRVCKIMDVRTREVAAPDLERVVGGDTSYPLGISGCNKSPNQVDIWRMERWNWFLAASKSRVCQGVGRGKARGERRTADRFPTGFMPLFFIRPAREDVVHCVTASGILSPGRAVFQLASPFHCAFGTRLEYPVTLMRRRTPSKVLINPLRWVLEFGHAYDSETLRPSARNPGFAARIKKWLIELPVFAEPCIGLCARARLVLTATIFPTSACAQTKVDAVNLRA